WVIVAALVRKRAVAAVCLAAGLCVVLAVATVARLSDTPDLAYSLPTPWAVALVVGAGVAVVPRWRAHRRPGVPATAAAWLVLAALALTPMRGHAVTYVAAAPVIAFAMVVLIRRARSGAAPAAWPMRALVSLGVISYSAYLWNYPLTIW